MKKRILKTINILVILMVPFLSVLRARDERTLSPPTSSLVKTGEMEESLHVAKMALQKRNVTEFYEAIERTLRMLSTNDYMRKLRGVSSIPQNELIANEWLAFLLTTAPFLTEEAAFQANMNFDMMNVAKRDVTGKISVATWAIGQIAGRTNQKSDKGEIIRFLHVAQINLKTLRKFLKDSEILIEKQRNKVRQLEKEFHEIGGRNVIMDDDMRDISISREKAFFDALECLEFVKKKKEIVEFEFRDYGGIGLDQRFVKILLSIYPKDGRSVREAIFDVGYTKEECRDLLFKVAGRGKGTEYLYQELPPFPKEKKVTSKNPKN